MPFPTGTVLNCGTFTFALFRTHAWPCTLTGTGLRWRERESSAWPSVYQRSRGISPHREAGRIFSICLFLRLCLGDLRVLHPTSLERDTTDSGTPDGRMATPSVRFARCPILAPRGNGPAEPCATGLPVLLHGQGGIRNQVLKELGTGHAKNAVNLHALLSAIEQTDLGLWIVFLECQERLHVLTENVLCPDFPDRR